MEKDYKSFAVGVPFYSDVSSGTLRDQQGQWRIELVYTGHTHTTFFVTYNEYFENELRSIYAQNLTYVVPQDDNPVLIGFGGLKFSVKNTTNLAITVALVTIDPQVRGFGVFKAANVSRIH